MRQIPQQPSFESLFTATAGMPEKAKQTQKKEQPQEPILSFVTERQREVMRSSPYASFVRSKSLEELKKLDDTIGTDLYKKSGTEEGERKLGEWRAAVGSARTIRLEAEYKKVDNRFCEPQKGVFYLTDADGKNIAVGYKFDPYYFDTTASRTGMPTHHIEFNSGQTPTEISETGYRSHFLTFIPYAEVIDFADFLVKTLRLHLNVTAKIVFEEQVFRYDAALYPSKTKKKAKKRRCSGCGGTLDKDDECLDCDYAPAGEIDEDAAGFDEYEDEEFDEDDEFEDDEN